LANKIGVMGWNSDDIEVPVLDIVEVVDKLFGGARTSSKVQTAMPVGSAFYLKNAEAPGSFAVPQGTSAVKHEMWALGGMPALAASQQRMQLIAEDAGDGRVYLKSAQAPDMYLHPYGGWAVEGAGLIFWQKPGGLRTQFLVEPVGDSGSKFLLKSAEYQGMCVRPRGASVGAGTSLEFTDCKGDTASQWSAVPVHAGEQPKSDPNRPEFSPEAIQAKARLLEDLREAVRDAVTPRK